jgi:hypothetical protein
MLLCLNLLLQEVTMSPAVNRRLPISCEPCRARKIKCTRNSDPLAPCESCVRRGIPHGQCIYLGHYNRARQETDRGPHSESNEELLGRIRNLERIIQNHVQLPSPVTAPFGQSTPVSLVTDSSSYSLDNSVVSPAISRFRETPRQEGILRETKSGHLRYEPRASEWIAVLDGSPAAPSIDTFNGVPPVDADFPFSAIPVASIHHFLMILPPTSQCDELKAIFFQVFSPVRLAPGCILDHILMN